jgi:hypothetical protein
MIIFPTILSLLYSDLTATNTRVTAAESGLIIVPVYHDVSKVNGATLSWFFARLVIFSTDSWTSDYKNSYPILNEATYMLLN